MIKSIKVMLLPNNKQQTKIFQTSDAARYAYNWTVALQMDTLQRTGKYLSDRDARKLFTEHKKENQWLYNTSSNATKQAIKDCCNAFWRFVDEKKKANYKPFSKHQIEYAVRINKKLTRYDMQWHPKYKKKSKAQPAFYVDTHKIEFSNTHVKFEHIADSKRKNRAKTNWIKLAEKGIIPVDYSYTNPRVIFDGIHWWISIGIEVEQENNQPNNEGIGIDVGIKDLAICSDEEVCKNINKTKTVKKLKKKQRRLQRSISRKYDKNKKGGRYCKTCNIIKSEKQLLVLNHRLTNIRHNHIHQSTIKIIKQEPSFIVVEDLNIMGMMKNKHLSKAIQEQCLHEFLRQIEYKSNWNNIKFIKAERWFPSSKLCSFCGTIKKDLKLSDRVYKCECGNELDRDYNAALNLKKYGELIA